MNIRWMVLGVLMSWMLVACHTGPPVVANDSNRSSTHSGTSNPTGTEPNNTRQPNNTTEPAKPPPNSQPTQGKACSAPIDPGSCKNLGTTKYAWDKDKGRCIPYMEHCSPSPNNFKTMESCQKVCPSSNGSCFTNKQSYKDGARFTDIDGCNTCRCDKGAITCTEKACSKIPRLCYLPLKDGRPCKAAFRRYYFDSVSKQCKPFIFGGCTGNANNFATEQECKNSCVKP